MKKHRVRSQQAVAQIILVGVLGLIYKYKKLGTLPNFNNFKGQGLLIKGTCQEGEYLISKKKVSFPTCVSIEQGVSINGGL